MKKKYPDNIVYDEKEGFNANILPYGSNVGAPAIKVEDIAVWKGVSVNKVNKQFSAKFNELKEEYRKLVEEYQWNDLVYKSKFNFEPVIGESYHLYVGDNGESFLSLIEPTMWDREHIGSFTLNSERKWIKV
jgi:hypothetical protein